jgi:tetratricopeptide (TPR) repeat protein
MDFRVQGGTMKQFLFTCLIALSVARSSPAGDKARKNITLSDRFAKNTLKDYRLEGKVAWEKGKVTLAPEASLTRAIDLGPRAEVRLVVRRPKEQQEWILGITMIGRAPPPALIQRTGCISGAVGLIFAEGKVELLNFAQEEGFQDGGFIKCDYSERVTVHAGVPKGPEDWAVRVEARHGVVRGKAWPAGSAEPEAWQTTRFSGEPFWEVGRIRLASDREPCVLLTLEIAGAPPTPALSAERQKKADRAAALNRETSKFWMKAKAAEKALLRDREALKLSQEAYGEDHSACAICLNNLAADLADLGKFEESLPYHKQALAIERNFFGPDHFCASRPLTALGLRAWQMGRYREARRYYEESLRIRLHMLGPEHPNTAENWNNLGVLFLETGEYPPGRRHLTQALAVRRKTLGEQHLRTAEALNNLGVMCNAMGDYAATRKHLDQCLTILAKVHGTNHPVTLRTVNNLANILSAMGDKAAARKAYEHVLEGLKSVVPETDPLVATVSGNLGLVLFDLKDPGAASCFERALAILKKQRMEKHPDMARLLSGLGLVLLGQGKEELAHKHLEQALTLRREVLPADHPAIAENLFLLGVSLWKKGEHAAAIRHLQDARGIYGKVLGDHSHTATSLVTLSRFEAGRGNDREGWGHRQAATAMLARLTQRSLAASAERDHQAFARDGRQGFSYLLGYAEARPELGRAHARELAEAMLDWKAAGERTLTLRREAVAIARSPTALAAYEDLRIARHLRAQALMRGPGTSSIQKHRQLLEALQAKQDSLERQLADQLDDFARLLKERQLGLKAVAAQLKPTAALVGMVRYPRLDPRANLLGPDRYAAIVVWNQAGRPGVRLVFLGDADPIDRSIRAWREATQQGRVDGRFDKDLRGRVWEPLARALPDRTDRLFLIPEAGFALLPFEAIRLADGKYLVERMQLSYLASGRELLAR